MKNTFRILLFLGGVTINAANHSTSLVALVGVTLSENRARAVSFPSDIKVTTGFTPASKDDNPNIVQPNVDRDNRLAEDKWSWLPRFNKSSQSFDTQNLDTQTTVEDKQPGIGKEEPVLDFKSASYGSLEQAASLNRLECLATSSLFENARRDAISGDRSSYDLMRRCQNLQYNKDDFVDRNNDSALGNECFFEMEDV